VTDRTPPLTQGDISRYVGYQQADGSVLGDPASVELTKEIMALGWKGCSPRTAFDLLPVVIQFPGKPPHIFQIPESFVLEVPNVSPVPRVCWHIFTLGAFPCSCPRWLQVPLAHPEYKWFAEFGLKWYAVPVISNFRLEIGGISYTACPLYAA